MIDTAPIPALIQRHAGDAAFYWAQRSDSLQSPLVDLARLAHIDRLLQAHLDGLKVAGETGLAQAWRELERWNGAGEVFVCAVLALDAQDSARLQPLWQRVEQDPARRLDGFVHALAWTAGDPMGPRRGWIAHWLTAAESPLLRAAALQACALRGQPAPSALAACGDADATVRRAACMALAVVPGDAAAPDLAAALAPLLDDADAAVRSEAAMAVLVLGLETLRPYALGRLWTGLQAIAAQLARLTGGYRPPLERELRRLLRVLAVHLPCGDPVVAQCLALLAPSDAVEFALWHGDSAAVAMLLPLAGDVSLQAGVSWLVAALTGVDLQAVGLAVLTPPGTDVAPRYAGLPLADPQQLSAWWSLHGAAWPPGQRYLRGAVVDAASADGRERLLALLAGAPQQLRGIARMHWPAGAPPLALLERALLQYQWLAGQGEPWA